MTKKFIYLFYLGIVGYLCFEWFVYFQEIEATGNYEFIGFLYFVGGYFLVLVLLVVIGRFVFLIDNDLSQRSEFGKDRLFGRAIYLLLFMLFWLVVRWAISDEEQFVPESMLLAGVALAVVIISKKLFEASRQKQMQLTREKDRQQAELSLLRAQVNPHFLFNALNTLYNDALKAGVEPLTTNLEKLTDILRYQLQYTSRPTIALETEINFLQQYVDFQKHRFRADDKVHIEMKVHLANSELLIHPMILITFIENAFKHGISREQGSYVKIHVHQVEEKLTLEVTNSNFPQKGKLSSGIGVAQTMKLLAVYYPGYEYMGRVIDNDYQVELQINLKAHD